MSDAGWTPVGSDGTYRYSATALSVFWPEPEHRALIARWPYLGEHLGVTWGEHKRRTERHRVLMEQNGLKIKQLPGDVSGFEAFLAGKGVTNPSTDDLLAYPDMRAVTRAMSSWPPPRTDACWCGSGRRYKQCCRPHGLGTLE
jgi:hypothetical protein